MMGGMAPPMQQQPPPMSNDAIQEQQKVYITLKMMKRWIELTFLGSKKKQQLRVRA